MVQRTLFTITAGAFLLAMGTARADITMFNLTQGNTSGSPSLSGFSGPFATVTVDLAASGKTATITFDSDTVISGNVDCIPPHPCTYLMGDGGSAGVNVNATSWTLGPITGSNFLPGFTPGTYSDGGSGKEDGWGTFNQTIDTSDGFFSSSTEISFTVTDTSGKWTSATNVLTANSDGSEAAAHIFVESSACTDSSGALAACTTGFAADSGGTEQSTNPEPASIVLFGGVVVCAVRKIRQRFVV